MPEVMGTAPGHRRERRGSFHVRTGVAGKRVPPSTVLAYCIGAIALLASAGRTRAPKVDAKAVTDGDTITVYVNMANHPESGDVSQEVHKAATEWTKAWVAKNCQRADALQKIILDGGYRQVPNTRGEQVLAKKYRIRLRGIDAPESLMPYGKEAKEELVRLVQGKTLKISIYDSDRYGRLVGDVDSNGVSVQEHMLKKGLAWHCTAYDHRMELSKVTSTLVLPNPEKPWEWRKKKRSGTVCLDSLTMEQPAQAISDGMYAYKHRCEGGVDIHDIVVKKSTFRILLYYISTICLLVTVCCTLLSKESLGLGSLWSISFAGVIAKWLRCDPVKKESLVIMPTFGIQLEQHFWSGRVHRKFVPTGKILRPVLNECVTPVTCYWSLALLLRDDYGLMLVFKNLNPPAKMLIPIWKALCAFVDSNTLSAS
uniref:TNase-like domain-containing protein n=1 Tax=Setaria italica TaxID=4555 RepID=K3XR75_SETIT